MWLIIYTPEILISWDIVTHATATAFLFSWLCEPRNKLLKVVHKYHSLAFKHAFPIAAFTLRPATTEWRQTQQAADIGVPHLAPLDSSSLRESQTKSKWKRNKTTGYTLNQVDTNRLDLIQLDFVSASNLARLKWRKDKLTSAVLKDFRGITFPAALLLLFISCFYNVLYQITFSSETQIMHKIEILSHMA